MMNWENMDPAARLAWAEKARTNDTYLARFTSEELVKYRTFSDRYNDLARECREFEGEIQRLQDLLAETEKLRDDALAERDAYQATAEANAAGRARTP